MKRPVTCWRAGYAYAGRTGYRYVVAPGSTDQTVFVALVKSPIRPERRRFWAEYMPAPLPADTSWQEEAITDEDRLALAKALIDYANGVEP